MPVRLNPAGVRGGPRTGLAAALLVVALQLVTAGCSSDPASSDAAGVAPASASSTASNAAPSGDVASGDAPAASALAGKLKAESSFAGLSDPVLDCVAAVMLKHAPAGDLAAYVAGTKTLDQVGEVGGDDGAIAAELDRCAPRSTP